jgi:predicted GNAT family acetyltransferase
MLDAKTLVTLADANYAELAREHARWLSPTHIEEHTGLLLSAAGTNAPGPWNSVTPLGPEPAVPTRILEAAQRFFEPKARGYVIQTRAHLDAALDEACVRAGHAQVVDSPGMALTERVAAPRLQTGVAIRPVQSEADALAYVDVIATAYEALPLPAALTRKLFSQPARWRTPHYESFLVFAQERAVAGAQLLWSHGIAGVYWVGTRPDVGRRGYADALMRWLSNYAFDAGARAVILQASRAGEPVYRRIGFHEFTRYRSYRVPAAIVG